MKSCESKTMTSEQVVWESLMTAYRMLRAAKPAERGEHTRRYAVTISLFEHVLGYFYLMVMKGFTDDE